VGRLLAIGAIAVGLAVAALLALGLRDGSSGGTPLSPIAEAAERTSELARGRFAGTGRATGSGLDMTMSFSGTYDEGRSQLRMDFQTPAAPQVAAMMNPLTAVQDGLTMYMSSPVFSGQLPDGASWLKMDLSEFVAEPSGGPSSFGSVDARAVLGQLEKVSGDARIVGKERVRGVICTRYGATIDPQLQAEQLRDAGNDLAAELIERQAGGSSVDVWVDRKGLVRRTAMAVPFALPGGPAGQMSMTIDLFGFGAVPEIEVPPEDATFDATELGREMLEETLGQS
jgi:hypothetical protein